MVQCKEEVFEWFKELSGATRIELMCGLLNLCIPLEWRFFAVVIESLARRDYASLKDYEIKANTPLEFEEIANSNWLLRGDEQDSKASTTVAAQPADKQRPVTASTDKSLNSIRSKIVVYMCLLSSSNRVCATVVYKSILKQLCVENLQQTLSQLKKSEKLDNLETGFLLSDNTYNEIILLHTLARFHPAFTFEQQSILGQQLHIVQHWMDVQKYAAAAAATGSIPATARCLPTGPFPQHVNQYSQTQQFHHPFQSTNKQQHPQYHHQMQQQQYTSHLPLPNEFNQQLANMSLSANNLSVLPPYTLQLTVASPPGFESQLVSPVASDYSPVSVEQKSGRKDVLRDASRESDEESVRGAATELRNVGCAERLEKDSIVTNGDLNEHKKMNLDNSKSNSPLNSASSSSSSSPISSASNSLNGAIVTQQQSTLRQTYLESLMKKEPLKRYKDKLINISEDELWNMSEDDLIITLGMSASTAAKFRKALLSHSNYNGVRFHNNSEADVSEILPKKNSSPSVSPAVSFCSEKEYDGVTDNERVNSYLKTQEVTGSTRMSSVTKTVASQKWQTAHNKAMPNASASVSSGFSSLPSTNKQQTSSKSSSLSSGCTGSEASAKSSKTFESNVARTTGSNRVPWKSNPSETSSASVNKCLSCGSNCASNCTCSVSNGSSVATTPSSTPPPAIPTQPISSGMMPMSSGQSMLHPYCFLVPPQTNSMNGYTPMSEQLVNYWYALATMAAASAGGLPYLPPLPSPLAFTNSIPGFPPAASIHGANPSLIGSASSQSAKLVSCYNCGAFGHRGNECPQQSLEDVVKPSTFNMNFSTQPEFDSPVASHSAHHPAYPNQAPHLQPAPHSHQASYHYSTSPPHTFQEHSGERIAPRHGTHPHT